MFKVAMSIWVKALAIVASACVDYEGRSTVRATNSTSRQKGVFAHILQRGVLNPDVGSKYAMCAGKRGTTATKILTKCFIHY